MTIKPYYQDNYATQYQGHVLNILPQLQPESIQCCVTSPPYWGLRDYGLPPQIWDDPGGCEHEWDIKEIKWHSGTNAGEKQKTVKGAFHNDHFANTAFCFHCNAWRGSLGLEPTPELYIQHIVQIFREIKRVIRKDGTLWLNMGDSYASQPASTGISYRRDRAAVVPRGRNLNGLKAKDLCGIPWRVALALQADGWWLRSDIIWSKPNPMPESVTDRPTRAHEYVFLLTRSAKYFYDADAVREKADYDGRRDTVMKGSPKYEADIYPDQQPNTLASAGHERWPHKTGDGERGRNLRSVWTIPTQPYPKAHFAVFPEKLVETCILAGTKKGDTVLDPFSGRGTVLTVAKRMFRKAVGIDLKAEYCDMSLPELKEELLNFNG